MVEVVHLLDPPGKAHLVGHPQFLCQRFQRLTLLSVAGDDKTQLGVVLLRGSKAADEGGDILYRIEPGGDAHHYAVLIHFGAKPAKIGDAVRESRFCVKYEPIINGVKVLWIKAAGDEQIYHGIADTNTIVEET